jgi:hypothetical protein
VRSEFAGGLLQRQPEPVNVVRLPVEPLW